MATQAKIRVLIVDDNPLFLQTMRSLLEPYPDVEVIGEANDGSEAVERVAELQPAVVLMDVHLRKTMDGIAATRMIKARCPNVVILGLSWDTRDYVVSAMRQAGAMEVLTKDQGAANEVYGAIRRTVALNRRSDEAQA